MRPPRSGPPAVVHVHYKGHVPRCAAVGPDRYLGCAAMALRRVFKEVWPARALRPKRAGAWAREDSCDAVDAVHRNGRYAATRHYLDVQRHCAPGAWRPYRPSDLDCGAFELRRRKSSSGDGGGGGRRDGIVYVAKADNATLARHDAGNRFALPNDKVAVVAPGHGGCDALGPDQW